MKTPWISTATLATALACAALVLPSAAVAAPSAAPSSPGSQPAAKAKNLVKNGGFEADPCSADGSVTVTPKYWQASKATSSVVCWATEQGGFPSNADRGPKKRGAALLAGGPGSAKTTVSQSVTVPAGPTTYVLTGYLGGFERQEDATVVTVTWRDSSGAALGTFEIGPVTSKDRKGKTALLKRTSKGAVPATAVSADVTVVMTRTEGSYNDGYLDALSLKVATG